MISEDRDYPAGQAIWELRVVATHSGEMDMSELCYQPSDKESTQKR